MSSTNQIKKKVLYFDCFSGISGDMSVGALLDLGIDHELFMQELSKLTTTIEEIDDYKISISKKEKMGLAGTDFNVSVVSHQQQHHHHHHHSHPHRNLQDIEKIIEQSSLKENVKILSKKIFNKIAVAEAKIHSKDINEIHFHEVGAIDSIIDIVGTAICIDLLNIDKIYSSPLHVGKGWVKCAHGLLPVPAPATLEILSGVPIYAQDISSELVTPTGAAIIKTLVDEFISLPKMQILSVGYGLGKKDFTIPNMLRIILAQTTEIEDKKDKKDKNCIILETNIDDMNPEIYSYLMPKILENGALDVFFTHIIMKKNRPAITVSVLCNSEDVLKIEELLFKETTTFGIRKYSVSRRTLKRETIAIKSKFGSVKAKVGFLNDKIIKYAPEYEECKLAAERSGVSLREVYEDVIKNC
ncbi:MAG: nickel pincer cofactor biosynthesis protein LarC [Oligoflexia bacterium]|nr:nickel pincer cofactor biosynthesis protein LarC [Oligoflexia bacterium]